MVDLSDFVTKPGGLSNGHAGGEMVVSSNWDRLPQPGLPRTIAGMGKRCQQLLAQMRQECLRRTHGSDTQILAQSARISRAFTEYQQLTTQVLAAELL